MQKEFKDPVFEFVKEVSDFDIVLSIFLFGSVTKEEADKRSDIDFLIVFDTERNVNKLKEKKEITQIVLDLERKFDRGMQVVFSNKKFDGFDRQFLEEVFKEGILLFGRVPQIDIQKLKLRPHSLFYYSLRGMSKSDKMRVRRALYGHKTIKKYKGKTYKSEVKGLIEHLNGQRTGIASVLIPTKNSSIFINTLKNFGVKYQKIDVWISEI